MGYYYDWEEDDYNPPNENDLHACLNVLLLRLQVMTNPDILPSAFPILLTPTRKTPEK